MLYNKKIKTALLHINISFCKLLINSIQNVFKENDYSVNDTMFYYEKRVLYERL